MKDTNPFRPKDNRVRTWKVPVITAIAVIVSGIAALVYGLDVLPSIGIAFLTGIITAVIVSRQ